MKNDLAKNVLVFDLGASSGRAVVCSYEDKQLCYDEIHRFTTHTTNINEKGGLNIESIFKEIHKAIDKAKGYDIDAVSVDTWGVDFALLDENGNFVHKPVFYSDRKTDGIPEQVHKKISEKELYMRSGIKQLNINTLYQLLAAKRDDPTAFENAYHMLMMPDLIAYYLTGVFANEYTQATTGGLIDPETKNWDWELIEQLGLPKRIFGKIVMPGEQIGFLKAEFATKEVPVFAAPSHDTASAILAVPSNEKKFAYISCGTWALVGTELKEPVINDKAFESDMTNEGGYNGSITFLKNIRGTWFLQECARYFNSNGEVFTFNDMEAFAKSAPPFIAKINPRDPFFENQEIDMPQKISDYCERTGQTKPDSIAQTLRIIYESLAAEFANTIESLEELMDYKYPAIHMVGGGSRDAFLCQLTADASGRTVIAGPTEATAIGNAVSTLIALKEIGSLEEAREIIRHGTDVKEYYPNHNNNEGDGRR